jgi:hypothetical protein
MTMCIGRGGILLDDVVKRNQATPSFEIPPKAERENVEVGTYVKLVFINTDDPAVRPERMWVRVTATDYTATWRYTGVLDNRPLSRKMPPRGSIVLFGPEHICGIMRDPDVGPN